MDQLKSAEQLECYEFLDLSDVDDRERNQLASTLYARDGGVDQEEEDHSRDDTPTEQRYNQQQGGGDEENYWRNGGVPQYTTQSSKYQQPGFATKQQSLNRRGGEEETNSSSIGVTGGGYQSDSRPVSRTESVLTDISSSYLSSSASSLHVPNNAQQYPVSVTSPPLIINTVVCNGGQNWPAEGALIAGGPGQHPGAYVNGGVNASDLGLASFDSGNASSATGSHSAGNDSSLDATDADASTSSSTLTTSEIIERAELLVVEEADFQGQKTTGGHLQQQQHHHHHQVEMSQQQQQQQGSGGGAGNNVNHGQPTVAYQTHQQHFIGQHPQQAPHQQTFIGQGGHMYQMLPHSVPSNVFVGNMTANVNVHGMMSHPFIPAVNAAAAAAGGVQPTFIEMQGGGGAGQPPGMIHTVSSGGHEIVQQQQQNQPSHHHQSQGHMMGSGTRVIRRARGRGGINSSHRREYGGGRMQQQQHQQSQGHMQHFQHSCHHGQQVHQQAVVATTQQPQQQQQQQQPEMMAQIIDQQQMVNPSGFIYYSPYPAYYNQMTTGHHQAAAAAQHASGNPFYMAAPPMPMYGHHIAAAYQPGVFVFSANSATQPASAAQGGQAAQTIMSPEFVAYGESGKANAGGAEEGQQQQQQQQQIPSAGEQPGAQWTHGQGPPVEYQEMVSPHGQQLVVEGGGEDYPGVDQGFVEQQQKQQQPPPQTHHHTLNPNVANFMTLKQQQELNEKQRQQQQQQHQNEGFPNEGVDQPQMIHMNQQHQVQMMVAPSGYEHMQQGPPPQQQVPPPPQQTMAYDMSGQPVLVNEQGEMVVQYMTNVEGMMVENQYNPQPQQQQSQVPLNVVVPADTMVVAAAEIDHHSQQQQQQQQQPPNNLVYTNMMNPSNNNNSPKVPVVTTTPIVQNNNNNNILNSNVISQQPQPSGGGENVNRMGPPNREFAENVGGGVNLVAMEQQQPPQQIGLNQENVPNVNQPDGNLSTLMEQKMVIMEPTITTTGGSKSSIAGGNKTWPQQHDSNNNVAINSAAPPAKKVVTTTSVAVTAAPGRSPMVSPRSLNETADSTGLVNGGAPVTQKSETTKANAIQQTDVVVPPPGLPVQKKLTTNTVSVTATPAAINGGAAEKPQVAPTPVAPSSWASLFASSQKPTASGEGAAAKKLVAVVSPFEGTQIQQGNAPGTYSPASSAGQNSAAASQSTVQSVYQPEESSASQADRRGLKLGDFLSKYQIDNTTISMNPRGLTNRSNYCYINAIVQALVACPPFYHVMKQIQQEAPGFKEKSTTPIIDAMVDLVNEFSPLHQTMRINRREKGPKGKEEIELNCPPPFEPTVIHKILNSRGNSFKVEGRQEDAEEFLSYLLNGLNDEMVELIKLVEKPVVNGVEATNGEPQADEGDDWQVIVNNRNKGTVTRTTDFGRTPIGDIFRGQVRSRLQREGDTAPRDVIQPFFTLQLDIEKVSSVKEALEQLVVKDQLEGVTCTKTNQEVAAWQQYTLEKLPMVLILHLKLFDYTMGGCTKILKTVMFPIELKIDTKILSSKKYQSKQKQYKLFAVVYHDGKEASKGHYITDVYNTAYSSWIRYDDSMVRPVKEHQVLHPKAPRVPYLLYYRRCDTITPTLEQQAPATTGGLPSHSGGGRSSLGGGGGGGGGTGASGGR